MNYEYEALVERK